MTATGRRIFSLDAGRKYFSIEELKTLVAKAAQLGYTDIQLLFFQAEDGIRDC